MMDRTVFRQVRLPLRFKWIAIGWLVAEVAIFAALVHTIGLGGTVLLGFATTVLGIVMMRRLGTETMASLRAAAVGGQPRPDTLLDGMLAGLGAVLLTLPGFLANFAGLALASPTVRRQAMRRFGAIPQVEGGRARRAAPGIIDLGPADWRSVDRQ